MRIHHIALLLLFATVQAILADEPLWTDQVRLEKRDYVATALVISDQIISNTNEPINLHHAVIEVKGMKKGRETSVGTHLNVYYELSPLGVGYRCPHYAMLTKGDDGVFYLRYMTDEIKKYLKLDRAEDPAFFLEMGSDVGKENTEQSVPGYPPQGVGSPEP